MAGNLAQSIVGASQQVGPLSGSSTPMTGNLGLDIANYNNSTPSQVSTSPQPSSIQPSNQANGGK